MATASAASASSSGLGFGLVFSLQDDFSSTSRTIQNEFNRLTNGANSMSERVANSMDNIYKGMAQVGTGVAMLMPLKSSIDAFAEFDSLQRGMLAVMKNNVQAVGDGMTRLNEVAKLPGLSLKEAVQGSVNLQAAGLSADLARRSLMGFGNALATVGRSSAYLSGVNLALSQIMSKGKVQAQEINQIAERVPQIRQLMKAAFGTSNTEELQKMNLSSERFIEGVVSQLEKLPKVTGGIQNSIENLQDSFWKMKVSVGRVLAPAFAYLAEKVQIVFEAIEKFAQTNLGKTTIQIIGLITSIAAASLIMSGAKKMFGSLGSIFGAVSSGAKLLTGALTGASGGFSTLATAMKSFMASNFITIIIMAIVIVLIELYRAWNSFTDLLEGKTQIMSGYMGFLQTLGGYLQAIAEIFSTATSEGWSMSKAMEDMLQKMGILDNVIALGTWIVRIREFIIGLIEPIKSAFSFFADIVSSVFKPMAAAIGKMFANTGLARMMWSMKVIHNIGWAIGSVFGLIIKALAIVVAAVVGVGMTFAVIISGIIRAIMWLVGFLYDMVKGFFAFTYSIGSAIWELIKWIGNGIAYLGTVVWGLITTAYETGKNFVLNLWEGIKSVWSSLVQWVTDAWGKVTGVFGQVLNFTGDVIAAPAEAISDATTGTNFLEKNMAYRTVVNNAPAAAMYSMQPQVIQNTQETVKNVTVVTQIDGRDVHKSINDISSTDDSLYGAF